MANVIKTDLKFDLSLLNSEIFNFIEINKLHSINNQICLTHPENIEDLYLGAGSLYNRLNMQKNYSENDFNVFTPQLRNTYIENVFHQICKWSPYKIGRVRVIKLAPKSCLSFHYDIDIRYHIALKTNKQCLMFFENDLFSPYNIPADGFLYRAKTNIKHTVMNGDAEEDRYHLVFSSYSPSDDYSKFDWNSEIT